MWLGLKIKQEGLRRFWSMFPLARATHFGIPVFGATAMCVCAFVRLCVCVVVFVLREGHLRLALSRKPFFRGQGSSPFLRLCLRLHKRLRIGSPTSQRGYAQAGHGSGEVRMWPHLVHGCHLSLLFFFQAAGFSQGASLFEKYHGKSVG